ncbi:MULTISPECIES: nucleotidyltransferase family protein [unclassified Lebetimonas]|uniref:nucleotidyltransferase family protein n=1 Tax=unclassified Lebetimonas TaxID=2648158 RepID=UPI0004639B4A|nr:MULTISPECIES: nucleotidyltransferase domain-containing protein [unclassified Lebetimonas]
MDNAELSKEYILRKLDKIKPVLRKKYSVKKIGIFGSFANENFRKDSDIDFYVEFEEKNFDNVTGVLLFLEKFFKKKIDIVYPHKNAKFLENIKKKVIYG